MLGKEQLLNLAQTLWMDESTTLEEDLAAWNIDHEGFHDVAEQFALATYADILKAVSNQNLGEVRAALHSLFYSGMGLGYKAALENEMERLTK